MAAPKMVTILDCAEARGAKVPDGEGITMGAVEATGLPFFAGCQRCGASLVCSNAYPTQLGYIHCRECLGDSGFRTAKAFEAWETYREEQHGGED